MRRIEEFIYPTQKKLQSKLRGIFKGNYISRKGEFVLIRGEAPVLLVAHMDTVHKEPVSHICRTKDGSILMSPQGIGGDDRCGVYALVSVYEQSKVKPWLLFTCDEEVGGVGAEKFCSRFERGELPKELTDMKMIIEIDRKGSRDAVYYDCDNKEFEAYITSKGFVTNHGSFSDISYIAPELGVAAVNLSSGYYNAHTLHEYINRKEIDANIQKVIGMVADATAQDFPQYEYRECRHFRTGGGCFTSWRDYYEYYGILEKKDLVNDPDLEKIPESIRQEYEALLDFYTPGELEMIRAEQGDRAIVLMFETEFGSWAEYNEYYGIDPDVEEFDDDDEGILRGSEKKA